MSGHDFVVPPRSWDNIEAVAANVRSHFGLASTPHFPVIDFIEKVLDHSLSLVRLLVEEHRNMSGAEGYTDPNGQFIILREDVYEGACSGNGRDRFTVAHELGHLFMHTRMPLARALPGQSIKPFRLSEPQANYFAAALLMPRAFISRADTVELIAERHGASAEASAHRLDYLIRKGLI